jgi:nicotinate-nucleotide adenylyltransferase
MKNSAVNWSDYTVILGGTFDPPHLSHLKVVRDLIKNLGVARVIVMPAANPPQKVAQSSSRHRLKMSQLQFAGMDHVEVSDHEIKRELAGKPSYSIDTVSELKPQHSKLAFVIGSDQLDNLTTWHRFQEILGLCDWITVGRSPDGMTKNLQSIQKLVNLGLARSTSSPETWGLSRGHFLMNFKTEAPEMSSTEIRRLIALQETPTRVKSANLEGFLHPDVSRYLKDHKLYGT